MHQSAALAPVISMQKECESFDDFCWLVILDLFRVCVWERALKAQIFFST